MQNGKYMLTTEEREQFWEHGYLGPYTLCSPEEMLNMQPEIEKGLETDAPDHKNRVHKPSSRCSHNSRSRHASCYYQADGIYLRAGSSALANEFFHQRTGCERDPVAPRFQLLAPRTTNHHFGMDCRRFGDTGK